MKTSLVLSLFLFGMGGHVTVAMAQSPGAFTATGNMITGRFHHTATLLPNGMVLVTGGEDLNHITISSAELYDPASGTWSTTGPLATARASHTATLLQNGKILVAAGTGAGLRKPVLATAELYDVGLGFHQLAQPKIERVRFEAKSHRLLLTGSNFQGLSEASGGNSNQQSSTNYPVVQLRSIDNEQVSFLPVDPGRGWSDTVFGSLPVEGFVSGPALVTVFTNGIPSDAKYLVVPQ